MLICYHNDFDGVASAALVACFLRDVHHVPLHTIRLMPVDYDLEPEWRQAVFPFVEPDEDFVIVDFRYHPQAWLYFDHHPTAFSVAPMYRMHWDTRVATGQSKLSAWRPDVVSCARVVYEALREVWPAARSHLSLVLAADKIDGARYASPQEYYDSDEPGIAINRVQSRMSQGEQTELVRRLVGRSLTEVATYYEDRNLEIKAMNYQSLSTFEPFVSVQGVVGVCDTVGSTQFNLPFAGYYFQPKLKYTVSLRAEGDEIHCSLGHNPWLVEPHHDLSVLARQFGGGGHRYAAGCEFRGADARNQSIRAVQCMVQTLNKPVSE